MRRAHLPRFRSSASLEVLGCVCAAEPTEAAENIQGNLFIIEALTAGLFLSTAYTIRQACTTKSSKFDQHVDKVSSGGARSQRRHSTNACASRGADTSRRCTAVRLTCEESASAARAAAAAAAAACSTHRVASAESATGAQSCITPSYSGRFHTPALTPVHLCTGATQLCCTLIPVAQRW